MFLRQLWALFWQFFDVLAFIVSAFFLNMFAYSFGIRWLWLSLGLTLLISGLASEIYAANAANTKGGD